MPSDQRDFGGYVGIYKNPSDVLTCYSGFIYWLPPDADKQTVPFLYPLSGLTCTDEKDPQKATDYRLGDELGTAVVYWETSPRGNRVADDFMYDIGTGAGFYNEAPHNPYRDHYKLWDYVQDELPKWYEAHFPLNIKTDPQGHSMGGHGALDADPDHPNRYRSVSAFDTLQNPLDCPWGKKAFDIYLGAPGEIWKNQRACDNIRDATYWLPNGLDQGNSPGFLPKSLRNYALLTDNPWYVGPLQNKDTRGYDHSYPQLKRELPKHLRFLQDTN
uniref:S-formylglutathione hydrolase YeiG n=1 Tax=uncultured prokaryote TaxID=198431 RepID=B6VG94_9ZZZZ|nr:esterase [uncultured prokaryote]